MGTVWHATLVAGKDELPDGDDLRGGIQDVLDEVNRSMSTYRPDSEISRFNRAPPGAWFDVSQDFYTVLQTALAVGRHSGGAYDVSVGPLVDLWGFGPTERRESPPDAKAIAERLARVGQHRLRLHTERPSVRKLQEVELDFSSLAKGFAVDRVADWLLARGVDRFLVEVGGELRLSGMSGRGDSWRIAIEQPDGLARSAVVALELTDIALATSGDYRNFFEHDGKRYSHSIDPRTGWPVSHDLVSVTVLHDSAMRADAWATALLVLGFDAGMAVARDRGLAVYFMLRDEEGFVQRASPAFEPYLAEPYLAASGAPSDPGDK
ncbi:MAG: FAD:protein FMN transferase [Halioglobus sp.]|nr:FAD:protein FMN transferase [Halioglobus sp.]